MEPPWLFRHPYGKGETNKRCLINITGRDHQWTCRLDPGSWGPLAPASTWNVHSGCCFHRCVFSVSQLCPTLGNPMDCIPQDFSYTEFSRKVYWSWLSLPSPGNLPDPGIEPGPLALGVQSLTNWTTREAPDCLFFFSVRKNSRNVTHILPQSDG